jgi:hypothetical protein
MANHVRTPVVEDLKASEPYTWFLNIDPVKLNQTFTVFRFVVNLEAADEKPHRVGGRDGQIRTADLSLRSNRDLSKASLNSILFLGFSTIWGVCFRSANNPNSL